MLDHHIQRTIVYQLALANAQRFSELKPDDIESKLFTYHLKKVVGQGYVTKDSEGLYELTPEGRRLGVSVLKSQQDISDRAHSILFLVIRRASDGAYLLYKRLNHPLKDRVGFMHSVPVPETEVADSAAELVKRRTGLTCSFSVLGNGYFRMFKEQALESFTHFTLLVCEDAEGELIGSYKHAEYFWQTNPDFNDKSMLPNMPILVENYERGKPFFVEKTFIL